MLCSNFTLSTKSLACLLYAHITSSIASSLKPNADSFVGYLWIKAVYKLSLSGVLDCSFKYPLKLLSTSNPSDRGYFWITLSCLSKNVYGLRNNSGGKHSSSFASWIKKSSASMLPI